MVTEHTVRSFDDELKGLAANLTELGTLAEGLFADAVSALLHGDAELAMRVISQDKKIDALDAQVEEEAIQIIARRQPMAIDLREIVGAIRIAGDLERIGDLAKNIAKRATALGSERPPHDLSISIETMSELARGQLRQVLSAYAERDSQRALDIREKDVELDELHTAFFRKSIDHIANNYSDATSLAHLLFCAKNIERVGDHVTNISENVYFIATGITPEEERRKHDTSSTLNPSLSGGSA